MVSYLTILFLGKPPGGSLPVLSTQYMYFSSYLQLALLKSAEEGNYSTKESGGREDRLWDRYLRSGHTNDRAT